MIIKLSDLSEHLKINSVYRVPTRSGSYEKVFLQPDFLISRFGFAPGDRVSTPKGKATVIGSSQKEGGELYFLLDKDSGISYWEGLHKPSDFESYPITKIPEDSFVHPVIQDVFKDAIEQRKALHLKEQTMMDSLCNPRFFCKFDLLSNEELIAAEKLFLQERKMLSISEVAVSKLEEVYNKLLGIEQIHKDKIARPLVQLRLIQIAILKEGLNEESRNSLIRVKNSLVSAMILGQLSPENILSLADLQDPDITLENQHAIGNKLWENRGKYSRDLHLNLIHSLLLMKYTGSDSIASFIDEISSMSNNLKLVHSFCNEAISTANQYAPFKSKKSKEEAIKWYDYALQNNHLYTEVELNNLRTLAHSTTPLSAAATIAQDNVRWWLSKYYYEKHDADFETVFNLIDPENLNEEQRLAYDGLGAGYYFDKSDQLYEKLKEVQETIKNDGMHFDSADEWIEANQFQDDIAAILNEIIKPSLDDSHQISAEKFNTLKEKAAELLSKRWGKIKDSNLAYPYNKASFINDKCMELAELIDKKHKLSLLMPTVSEVDGFDNNINSYKIGEFILTEDNAHFIPMKLLLENTVKRANQGETDLPLLAHLTSAADEQEHVLTEREQNRLFVMMPRAKNLVEMAKKRIEDTAFTALGALQQLRMGLLKGDYNHHGQDLDAGKNACEAIIDFFAWFESLSPEDQTKIKLIHRDGESIETVLSRLVKTEEAAKSIEQGVVYNVNYCVEQTGRMLQRIIDANTEILANFQYGRGDLRKEQEWSAAQELMKLEYKGLAANKFKITSSPALPSFSATVTDIEKKLQPTLGFLFDQRLRLSLTPQAPQYILCSRLHTDAKRLWKTRNQLSAIDFQNQINSINNATFLEIENKKFDATSVAAYREYFGKQSQSSAKKELSLIKKQDGFVLNQEVSQRRLHLAKFGTSVHYFDNGTLKLDCVGHDGAIKQFTIFVDLTDPHEHNRYSIMEEGIVKKFSTLKHAIDEIKVKHLLLSVPAHAELRDHFINLNAAIDHPRTTLAFKESLLNLRSNIITETFYNLRIGKTPLEISQGRIGTVMSNITTMANKINSDESMLDKLDEIKRCRETLRPTQVAKGLGKTILAVFIAGTVAVVCAAIGAGLGIWTGPGAAGTTLVGLSFGWVLGTTIAAAVTGVTVGGLSAFGLFKRSPMEKAIDQTLQEAKKGCSVM